MRIGIRDVAQGPFIDGTCHSAPLRHGGDGAGTQHRPVPGAAVDRAERLSVVDHGPIYEGGACCSLLGKENYAYF